MGVDSLLAGARYPLLGTVKPFQTNITIVNGNLLRVDTTLFGQQGSRSNILNTAKRAMGAAVGAAKGAVTDVAEAVGISSVSRSVDRTNGLMATKRTVVLPAGTRIKFRLSSPLTITQPMARRGST
jgi:hypothetical protein